MQTRYIEREDVTLQVGPSEVRLLAPGDWEHRLQLIAECARELAHLLLQFLEPRR